MTSPTPRPAVGFAANPGPNAAGSNNSAVNVGIDAGGNTPIRGIDTESVGEKTFSVVAPANAGNETDVEVTYEVHYDFGGFEPPLGSERTRRGPPSRSR